MLPEPRRSWRYISRVVHWLIEGAAGHSSSGDDDGDGGVRKGEKKEWKEGRGEGGSKGALLRAALLDASLRNQ